MRSTAAASPRPPARRRPCLVSTGLGLLLLALSPLARATCTAGTATHFTVAVSALTAPLGQYVQVTVTALDNTPQQICYTGTVTLTSSDGAAAFSSTNPSGSATALPYTFVGGDGGQHVFYVQFGTAGFQTVTATDGTISGTSPSTTVAAVLFSSGANSYDFSNNYANSVTVGQSATQNLIVQLSNSLQFSSAALDTGFGSSGANDFALGTVNCSQNGTVQSCTVPVTFQPSRPGIRQAPLVITDTNNNKYYLGLTGLGAGGALAFTPGIIQSALTYASGHKYDDGTIDSAGNMYLGDNTSNATVSKMSASGTLTVIVGGGANTSPTFPIAATSIALHGIGAVRADAAGNLYIADPGDNIVLKYDRNTGEVTSVAGQYHNGTGSYSGDGGAATSATLAFPADVAIDASGNIYIADGGDPSVRKVDASTGIISTYAGECSAGSCTSGTPTSGNAAAGSPLKQPEGLALDSAGDLYISDLGNHQVYRVDATTKDITWFAGDGTTTNISNCSTSSGCPGDGSAANSNGVELSKPLGLAVDTAGDVYIVDNQANVVRRVDATASNNATPGTIHTIAGGGSPAAGIGDNHAATDAKLNAPYGVWVDSVGTVYIGDETDLEVRKIPVTLGELNDFGSILLAKTSSAQSLLITNVGNQSFTLSSFTPSGDFANDSGSTTCASSLNPGVSCSYGVTFTPTALGARTGSVAVSNGASGGNATASLTGTGVQISLSPASASFASSAVSSPSAAQTFTLTNPSSQSFSAGATSITGTNSADFAISNDTCNNATINASSTCTLQITYTASTTGAEAAALNVTNTASNSPQTASLSGAIINAPSTMAKTNGDSQTATVGYQFTNALTVTVSGSNTAPAPGVTITFTINSSNGASAVFNDNGSNVETEVTDASGIATTGSIFANGTAGSYTVTATATKDATGSTISSPSATFNLTNSALSEGVGTQTASPMQFTFYFGSTTSVADIQVLTGGVANQDFTQHTSTLSTNCLTDHSYSSGQFCTVQVDFNPKAPGVRFGAVVLYTGSTQPYTAAATVYFSGIGTGPAIAFLPSSNQPASSAILSNLKSPAGVRIDPAGDVFAVDAGNSQVLELASGASSTTTVATGLSSPHDVAVDAAGNVFIAQGTSGLTDKVYRALRQNDGSFSTASSLYSLSTKVPGGIVTDGKGNLYVSFHIGTISAGVLEPNVSTSTALAIPGVTFKTPEGMALDGNGHLYIADPGQPAGSQLIQVNLSRLAATTVSTPGITQQALSAVAIDAAGDIYLTDSGAKAVYELPASGGNAITLSGGLTLASGGPAGIALDGAGNIYVPDSGTSSNASVYKLDLADAPSLANFGHVSVGGSSTAETVTAVNIGNANLSFHSISVGTTNFAAASGVGDCSTSNSVAVGSSCTLGATFTPQNASGQTDTLTAQSNTLNTSYTSSTLSLAGTGDPIALTIAGIAANNKVYDGTTAATLSGTATLSGVLAGDAGQVSLSGTPTAVFSQSAVGTGLTVTVTGYSLTGAKAGNYTLTSPYGLSLTANVTPAPLTVSGLTAQNKVYNGAAAATLSGTATLAGTTYGSDAPAISGTASGAFASANVANGISVTLSGLSLTGTGSGNYSITGPTAALSANITPAPLTVSGLTAQNKVYNGATAATLSGTATLAGTTYGSDAPAVSGTASGTFASANVGTGISVTLSGLTLTGTGSGNYSITGPTTALSANITPAPLTVSGLTAQNKVYNGATAATLSGTATLAGTTYGSDAPAVSGTASGTFASANVGTGISVTLSGLTLTGTGSGNYAITGPTAALSANITPAPLTVSGLTAQNKVYNGATAATLSGTATLAGTTYGSDAPAISGTASGSFASANVGTGISVTLSGLTLTGTGSGNYSITGPTTALSANITPATATVNVTGYNVTYDGNAHTATGTATGVGGANLNADLNLSATTHTAAGTYASDAWTFHDASGNYADANGTVSDTISAVIPGAISAGGGGSQVTGYAFTGSPQATVTTGGVGVQGVTVTFTAPASGASGWFSDTGSNTTTAITNSNGIATAAAFYANGATGNYSVTITATKDQYGNTISSPSTTASFTNTALQQHVGTAISTPLTFSFVFSGNTSVSAIQVLTNGAQHRDYTLDSGTTCKTQTYTSGQFCLVEVDFTPAAPGLRPGAAVLYTGAGAPYTAAATQYFSATGTGPEIAFAPGSGNASSAVTGLTTPAGLAVDPAGDIFAISGGNQVVELPAGASSTSATSAVMSGGSLSGLYTVAIDGAGNLYTVANTTTTIYEALRQSDGSYGTPASLYTVGGAAAHIVVDQNGTVYVSGASGIFEPSVSTSTPLAITGVTMGAPRGVALDGSGNLYVADSGNKAIYKINLSTLVATTVSVNGVTLQYPAAVTVDAAGDVYVADSGAQAVYEVLAGGGNALTLASGLNFAGNLTALAKDASGNIYYSDSGSGGTTVHKLDAVDAPSFTNFGHVTVGGSSTAQTIPVSNIGNANLSFHSLAVGTSNFTAASGSGACSTSNNLAAGDSCTLGATFTPQNTGALSDSLTVQSNTLNTSYTSTALALAGTGDPLAVTISGATANNKVYDGTTTATLSPVSGWTLSGVLSADQANVSVSLTGASITFSQTAVGNNLAVSASGLTLTGSAAYKYTLVQPTGLTANITTAPLTVTGITANNKVYDGATAATVTGPPGLSGAVWGDTVTLVTSGGSYAFASANVGTGIPVSGSGFTLGGASAGNYSLTQPGAGLSANITPAALTVTGITANNKIYDGTTAATVTGTPGLTGVVSGNTVTLNTSGGRYAFVSANVGTGIAVSGSGFTLGGTSAANYSLTQPGAGLTANITPAALTVTGITANNKVYDGTTAATVTGTPGFSGVVSGDTVTLVTSGGSYAFASANVGTGIAVSGTGFTLGGASAANYSLTQPGAGLTANITPAPLTVSGLTAQNKVYNGNTTASLSGSAILAGSTYGSDAPALSGTASGSFASANVGTGISVTLSGLTLTGTGSGNYSVTGPTTALSANITPAALTVTGITANNKVYDGTTAATVTGTPVLAGLVSGDTVSLNTSGGSYAFASASVGIGIAVSGSGFTLGGTSAGNYSLTQPGARLSANITPAALTVTGITANNKVYDGTTAATVTGTAALAGVVSGDAVTLNTSGGSYAFASAGVGTGIAVTGSGFTLSGAAAANYSLTQPGAGLSANITAAPLTVTGITANNKIYDGTTAATVTGTPVLAGLVSGDTVSLNTSGGSYAFASASVGTGIAVSGSGFTLGGASAANYSLTQPGAGLSANITPVTLTVAALNASMNYGGPIPSLTASFTGFVNHEDFHVLSGAPALATTATVTSLPGTYPISVSQGTLTAANYTFTFVPGSLTVSGFAQAQLSANNLDFGSQLLSTASTAATVSITNTGTIPLIFSSIQASGDYADTTQCGTLAAGASCVVAVTFTPSALGTRAGTLTLNDNAPGSPQTVALTGVGVGPGVIVTPGSLIYGSQQVGTTSTGQTITILNTGTSPLHVASVTASGDFSASGNCALIQAGDDCTVSVTFTPTATGARTGTATVTDDGGSGTQTVSLSGTGSSAGVLLSPAALNFRSVVVGQTSITLAANLTNTGTTAITGISLAASGDFAQTNDCPATLAGGASCAILVKFQPTVAAYETGAITATDNLGQQPLALSGTGIAPGIQLGNGALIFGAQLVSTQSPAQTISITNSGTAPLNFTSVTPSTGFGDTTDCTGALAAGAACSVNVYFAPSSTGVQSGTVTIVDASGTQTITTTGTGINPGLAITPSFTIFGGQIVGTTSPAQTLTLTNTGTAAITLNPATVTSDFTESDSCPATLAAGASCLLSVSFTPTALGNRAGAVTITGGGAEALATLFGQGTAPGLAVAPANLDYGSVEVSHTSAAQIVTVTNSGTAPATISAITIDGDFAQTNTCTSGPIAPNGGNCVISITMTPTTTGSRTGTAKVIDGQGGVHTVALTGVGQFNGLDIYPQYLNFGSLPVTPTGSAISLSGTQLSVSITNIGSNTVHFNGYQATGDFTESDNCSDHLDAGQRCTLSINFIPTAVGHRTGTLTINDDSGNGQQVVAMEGFGSPGGLLLTPPELNFGVQTVGITSASQPAQLINNTGENVSGLTITPSGEYNETNQCGTSLANGASCEIDISVTPVTVGAITGNILVSGTLSTAGAPPALVKTSLLRRNGGGGSTSFSLGVVALTATANPPGVGLSLPELSFAVTAIGAASTGQILTLTNTGTGLPLTGLHFTSSPEFPFSLATSRPCPVIPNADAENPGLVKGASCDILVSFKPQGAGLRTGYLNILADGGIDAPVPEYGIGLGPQLTVAPNTLVFGARPVATASAAQTLVLQNTGAQPLTVTSASLSGTEFALTGGTCSFPQALAVKATCTVTVNFTPGGSGSRNGTLTFASNSSSGPTTTVALTGQGNSSGLTISKLNWDFGGQGVGSSSSPLSLTVTNNTGGAVPINGIVLNNPNYTETSTCPANGDLANGASCTITVIFNPQAVGEQTGTLTINDGAGAQTIGMAGIGADFAIQWSGTNPAATTNSGLHTTYNLNLAGLGTVTQSVALSCVAQSGYTCSVAPASIALAGTATSPFVLTLASTAAAVPFPQPAAPFNPPPAWWWGLAGLAACFLTWAALRRRKIALTFAGAILLAAASAACGGAASGIHAPITTSVTVNATSSLGNSHTTSLNLVVE